MIWVLIGVVLLVLFGIVSMMQRVGELSRRIAKAKELRARLSDPLLKLQTETDFSEAFSAGEVATLAKQTATAAASLSTDFAAANRQLDSIRGMQRFVPTLTRLVAVAEIIEAYEDVEKRIKPVQDNLHKLADVLSRASKEVSEVEKAWSGIKQSIQQLLGDNTPQTWLQEWRGTDAVFTRLGAEMDDVLRKGELAEVHETVGSWEAALDRLRTWVDWQTHGAERERILAQCVQRLADQHGTNTGTYKDLVSAFTDVKQIRSQSAAEAADPMMAPLTDRLQGSLTERINRATQLLNFLSDPASRTDRLVHFATRLRALRDTWRSADVEAAVDLVAMSDREWADAARHRRGLWLTQSEELLVAAQRGDATEKQAVALADSLLQRLAEGEDLKRDLDQHIFAVKRTRAEWTARVDALEGMIAAAQQQLADANLGTHDEYQKWVGWQSEAAALRNQSNTQDEGRLSSLEAKVEAEQRVVDALVASRQNVDESLQQHLDQLMRRHGTDIPAPWTNRHGRLQQQLDTGDLTGAAWSALAMAEAMAEMSHYGGPGW